MNEKSIKETWESIRKLQPLPEYDTVEYISDEIEKSDKKIESLRNFLHDTESKLLIEHSFNRYMRHRLKVKTGSDTVTNVTPKK
jgi:hypothetical protein